MKSLEAISAKTASKPLYSRSNLIPGRVTEITHDINDDEQYVIVATNYFAGKKERYFAVPVLPAFIETDSDGGLLLINIDHDDLALAKRIRFDSCPTIKENGFFPSVYEVYGYEVPHTVAPRRKAI